MTIIKACCTILAQLNDMVSQLTEQDFTRTIDALGGATLGQHLRHTVEFFSCLQHGAEVGVVNYDKRAHDKRIETSKAVALSTLQTIHEFVKTHPIDKPLTLEVAYDLDKEEFTKLTTNYLRELVYNIEHAVHHMAIMKIGLRVAVPYVTLPHDFGIAASTIRYQASTAVAQN
jgi:hypothetical protein